MGSIGVWQVILILVIVLIIFGAGKLPKVMGDVAKGVKNFREGMKDDGSTAASPAQIDQSTTAEAEAPQPSKDEAAKT